MSSCNEIVNKKGDKYYPYYWTVTVARFQKGNPYHFVWNVALRQGVNKEGIDFHVAGAVRFVRNTKMASQEKDIIRLLV